MLSMIMQGLGAAFLLIAAVGVIRLPDPLQRMHSATKAGTLGTTLLLLGVMTSGQVDHRMSGWLSMIFLLLTLPLGAQMLARGTYLSGTPLEGLDSDPLADKVGRRPDETP